MAKSLHGEVRLLVFKPQLHYCLVTSGPGASHLTVQCLSFPIVKVGLTLVLVAGGDNLDRAWHIPNEQ